MVFNVGWRAPTLYLLKPFDTTNINKKYQSDGFNGLRLSKQKLSPNIGIQNIKGLRTKGKKVLDETQRFKTVSYTHLDVYKRQML